MYLRTCAPSEDLNQSLHSHSLIRISTRLILGSLGCKVSAQSDLSIRWAETSESSFSRVAAQLYLSTNYPKQEQNQANTKRKEKDN